MTKQHKATPEHWAYAETCAPEDFAGYACILELRGRVEALEAGQHPPQDKLDRLIALDRDDPTATNLAARPLLEKVARMADCIDQRTVSEIIAISNQAEAWLNGNPPRQPVAIEPRGCPTPGTCSCVEPAAQPEPAAPTDEALANFSGWFCRNYPGPDTIIHKPEWHAPKVFRAAADAIARYGTPAIQPVPVSERLPGPEDCDGDGRCWMLYRSTSMNRTATWSFAHSRCILDAPYTHWLPANSLPTPESPND